MIGSVPFLYSFLIFSYIGGGGGERTRDIVVEAFEVSAIGIGFMSVYIGENISVFSVVIKYGTIIGIILNFFQLYTLPFPSFSFDRQK